MERLPVVVVAGDVSVCRRRDLSVCDVEGEGSSQRTVAEEPGQIVLERVGAAHVPQRRTQRANLVVVLHPTARYQS